MLTPLRPACPVPCPHAPQIGTVAVNLQSLLRQGRDFAEVLVELPVMDNSDVLPDALLAQPARSPTDSSKPTVVSKGSVVMRVINIGREPRNLG